MKKVLLILVLVVILAVMLYLLKNLTEENNQGNLNQNQNEAIENTNENDNLEFSDALNTTYIIDGREVKLINGLAENVTPIEGSAKITVKAFGEAVTGDISYDEADDMAIILSYDAGGTGTFYYAVAAINEQGKYFGTNAVFLGDRIVGQNISIKNKILTVNYTDRLPNEAMTAQPSVAVTRYFKYENSKLVDANREDDLIIVDLPIANSQITSPLTFSGKARGTWFFEGSFPVSLVNWDGLIIAEGYATASGEWMTEEYVPFTGTLTFDKPGYGDRGAIIFQKDNPSGLPENDNALEISIRF